MIGRTVSHYRILSKLGEGGMGVVYKAEDTKLKRTVALKFLPPELTGDPDAKERFMREAQAAASLNHSHICTIHEVDEHEDRSFIAMEFVEGENLKDRIQKGPFKIDEVLSIAVQIAEGLQEAHKKGIVHRDIKSANVMLTASGQVKVMDFGLAKLTGRTKMTREGTTVGTAGYMSPEQAQGEDADHRSDIWSLGVVIYEMVTGLLPFKGDYEQGIVYQIINSAPAPLTSVRTGVPMGLERIVERCLEKRMDERYQTAADLIAGLRHLQRTLATGTEVTRQSMATAAGVKPAGKKRWMYWTIPIVVLAVVAAALLMSRLKTPHRATPPEEKPIAQQTSTPQEKSIAVLPFADFSPQHDQEYFCDGITEELINRLSNLKGLRVPARTSAFFFKGKTEDVRDIGNKLSVQAVLEGSVRKSGDELRITAQLINVADGYHLWSETYDRQMKDVFAIQDEISAAIVNALELKLTPQETQELSEHSIDDVKAYESYLKASRQIQRMDEKSIDSALVYLKIAVDIMGDNAELYAGMARAYLMYGNIGVGEEDDFKRAEDYANKALALKPDLPGALTVLSSLSVYEDYPNNMRNSLRYSKRAVSANPASAEALRPLAMDYARLGRPWEALEYAKMAAESDPLNPWRYVTMGACYLYGCQFGLAEEQFRAFYQADSTSSIARDVYSTALAANGKRREALAVVAPTPTDTEHDVETGFCLLMKYALLNDREAMMRVMTPEVQRACRRDFEWSYVVAERFSIAGAKEEALDWLENAVSRGFINYPFFQCNPLFDNIRGEDRFKKLTEKAKYEWEHFEVPE